MRNMVTCQIPTWIHVLKFIRVEAFSWGRDCSRCKVVRMASIDVGAIISCSLASTWQSQVDYVRSHTPNSNENRHSPAFRQLASPMESCLRSVRVCRLAAEFLLHILYHNLPQWKQILGVVVFFFFSLQPESQLLLVISAPWQSWSHPW